MIRSLLSLHRRSLTALALLLTCTASMAQTWTGDGDGISWSDPANWDALPASGNGTIITVNNGAALNMNQDLGSPFSLNLFQQTTANPVTITGNAIELVGSSSIPNFGVLGAGSVVSAPLILSGTQSNGIFGNGLTLSGGVSGAGQFDTSGAVTITGPGTWTGGTAVSSGTLHVAAPNALPAGGGVTLFGTTLNFTSPTPVAFSGAVGGNGTFQQSGPGTLSLSGSVGNAAVIVAGGTLQTTGGTYPLGGFNVTTVQNGGTLHIASTAAKFAGSVSVQNGGTLLAQTPGGFAATVVNVQSGGVAQLGGTNGFSGTDGLNIAAGATLTPGSFQQTTPVEVHSAGDISLSGGGLLTIGSNSTTSGTSTGGGTLVFDGTGINLNPGTSLAHTGGTTISGGVVNVNTSNALPDSGLLRISGGALNHTGTEAVVDAILLDGGSLNTNSMNAYNTVTLQSGSLSGNLWALFGAAKTTPGTVSLTGVLQLSAGITVSAGTMNVTGGGNLFGVVQNDAVISVSSGGQVGGSGSLYNGIAGTLSVASGGTVTNLASNAGILNISSGATLAIPVINSTGTVNVTSGTLPNAITSSGTVNVTGNATLAGPVANNGTVSVSNSYVSGNITGSGSLSVPGGFAGLSGSNSYTGGSTATGSVVNGTTNSIQGNWALTNSILAFNQNSPGTMAGTITGSGAVELYGTGKVTLTANNTYTGGVSFYGAGSHLGFGSNTAAGTGSIGGSDYKLSAEGGARTVSNPLLLNLSQTEFTGTNNLTFTDITPKTLSGPAALLHTSTATTAVAGTFLGQNTTTINVNAGTLRLGAAVNNGFRMDGAINVASGATLQMISNSPVKLGPTNLTGGTLIAPSGVAVPTGLALTATGTIQGRVSSEAGSLIEATGALVMGDSTSFAGYFSNGELRTQQHTVTILDKNQAGLGSLTEIGTTSLSGVLTAANGVFVDFSRGITGWGTVNSTNALAQATIINGDAAGSSPSQQLDFTGYVKGVGTFTDVTFSGTFSPGLSPAIVPVNGVSHGSSTLLVMEIGGLTPGSMHDQLDIGGVLALNGTLDVDLINGFNPAYGNVFNLFDGTTTGTFSGYNFPGLNPGLAWDTSDLYSLGNLNVVPEPSTGLLALLAAGFLARSRHCSPRRQSQR
jgi:fibronectin-binding autotransporter adhesin